MSVTGVYKVLTHGLGGQRRLIRRIAALCLVVMGVHAAADHLDDVVYRFLDAIDLFFDDTAAAFLGWLAQSGGMTPEAALHRSEAFATFIDLPQKDRFAIIIALLVELLLDIMLLDLAWGRHVDEHSRGIVDELKQSGIQMLDALRPLDLERLVVIPTLLAYAVGGAALSALAVEQVARDIIQKVAGDFLWAGHLAAALGILAAALLLWRFLPDMLHGALLRSRVRHDKARERAMAKLLRDHKFPRLAKAVIMFRLGSRGTWLAVIALPLALAGLWSTNLLALIQRTEVVP